MEAPRSTAWGCCTDGGSTKGSSSRNDLLQLFVDGSFSVASNHKTLVLELLGNVSWRRSRHLDPGLGEESTRSQNKDNVHHGLDWVQKSLGQRKWRLHVVCNTRRSKQLLRAGSWLPRAKKLDSNVIWESGVEHLGDDEDVGGQGTLQHDWHVGGVEQSDWVQTVRTSLSRRLDRKFHFQRLQVNHRQENQHGDNDLEHVWSVVSVEGLDQGNSLGLLGEQQVDKCNHSTFKLCSTSSVDGCWGKTSPENLFANVGGHEQRNTRTKSVTFLEQLVQQDDHDGCKDQLQNQQQTNTRAEITWTSVHACQNVHGSLTDRKQDSKDLLGDLEQIAVLFVFHVDC
ncbi:hypothetical protein OGAPHI_002237 [Ogataea philodendri]|uniref:Uncharacterized protein n=1 Tax=Ogataea philodendri TaxID=1378263 RepID=A0A9P8PA43_9ASCO|nr:uncharacterized protein OGAPHI_002237 [Ogataea philodendri]KAH3668483.1 hypothetical protein OGAPHI_002237 [Ogataea philodendri]